jgi:hypothetical protein
VDCIWFYVLYWFYICVCISEMLQLYGICIFVGVCFFPYPTVILTSDPQNVCLYVCMYEHTHVHNTYIHTYIHTLHYMELKSVKKTVGCWINHTISGTYIQYNWNYSIIHAHTYNYNAVNIHYVYKPLSFQSFFKFCMDKYGWNL